MTEARLTPLISRVNETILACSMKRAAACPRGSYSSAIDHCLTPLRDVDQEVAPTRTSDDAKFAAQPVIGTRLFYAVGAVELVDEAASIELLNKFRVNETL